MNNLDVTGEDAGRRERSISWADGALLVVDQCTLPLCYQWLRLTTVDEVIVAIAGLAVRGAPAIGVAGAFGVALSARCHAGTADEREAVHADAVRLIAARPTAVNLAWGVRRALRLLDDGPDAVLAEAQAMLEEDERVNVAAARRAADLLLALCGPSALTVATHCNTGRLAIVAEGTALGAIKSLARRDRLASVLVGETRPLLQGARLTTWELAEEGIAHRLCVDSAIPSAIARGLVDCVVVGADRVTANGDVANKVGTYSLAVVAARSGIPFVVVAPESSIDRSLADGGMITIEQRNAAEVLELHGQPLAPPTTEVYNPAFDVTPAELVTAVVSELEVYLGAIVLAGPSAAAPTTNERSTRAAAATTVGASAGTDHVRGALAAQAGELVAAASRLYRRGWMEGTSGNASLGLPNGFAVITASGRGKGRLTSEDVVLVRVSDGAAAEPGGQVPSAEAAIHAALYRDAPGCQAIVHAHCPYATAYASRTQQRPEMELARIAGYELIKGLGVADPSVVEIPVFPNWSDVDRLAAHVTRHLVTAGPGIAPVLLIAHHGATAWGASLDEACDRLECLEALCQLELLLARPL
jgi:methylthioribose-1-phosphate isomerase